MRHARTLVAVAASIGLLGGAAGGAQKAPEVEPKAAEIVRKMTDYLERAQNLRVQTEGSTEVVTKDMEKIDIDFASEVALKRPNRLRADRREAGRDAAFFYDGKTFTMYGKKANLFATTTAPPTLDAAIDDARDRLGVEAPAADLLYTDAYEGLMQDIVSGRYVGEALVDGVPCDHVAFRGKEIDFQLWVDKGAKPLPRKYVIVSKKVTGQPEFTVQMTRWDTDSELDDSVFTFKPPQGAKKIEFLGGKRLAKGRAGGAR